MRVKAATALAVALFSGFNGVAMAERTMDGGVTLVLGNTISSTADTTVFNGSEIDWDATISMDHRISDADTMAWYAWETASGPGNLTNFTNTIRIWETCYIAQNVSAAAGLWGSWLSPTIQCTPPPPCNNTPIILDLALDGYHLTGPEDPVAFDLDADGDFESVAWTSLESDDAFLCLDRNGNGRIDDGTELFGNATPLSSGEAAGSGFRALAEFDLETLGGDGNGVVDRGDAQFRSLCVWRDANRDGLSQQREVRPIRTTKIVALEYSAHETAMYDEWGNIFWLESVALVKTGRGSTRRWPYFDVILAPSEQTGDSPSLCYP